MNLLSLLRRSPKPPREVPPSNWSAPSYQRSAGLAPRRAKPLERVRLDTSWGARERWALERLGELTESGVSPWEAASRVFGGAGETPAAVGAGLSATLAGRRRDSVPR